jgi:Lon protease-like protein
LCSAHLTLPAAYACGTVDEIGLFPLGIVLLPTEQVPLHIFEPRYRALITECLEEEREFGLVFADEDGLRAIGTRAGVTEVLERFEDGRLNILAEGTTPFRMERRIGDMAYPAGDVVLLDDEPDSDDDALERARTTYADLVEEVTDARPEAETLAGLDAYGMAATVDINPAAKQALLELRSEPARLEQLDGLFAEALRRIRTAARVAEQASGNGHLKPGD